MPRIREGTLIYESRTVQAVPFRDSDEESSAIEIFSDRLVYRSNYRIAVSIESDDLKSISSLEIVWKAGDSALAWISIVLRFSSVVVTFGVSLVYIPLLRRCAFSEWPIEQKVTTFLTVLCLLRDFPLAGIYTSDWSIWHGVSFAVVLSAFRVFRAFHVIVIMLESVSRRSRQETDIRFLLNVCCTAIWALDACLAVLRVVDDFETRIEDDQSKRALRLMCLIVSDGMVFVALLATGFVLDETETFRFAVYASQWLATLAVRWSALWTSGQAAEVLEFTADNVFVLLAAYFHWPYLYVKDAVYEDSKLQELRDVVAVEKASDGASEQLPGEEGIPTEAAMS
jgi:hypothetical protein